MHKLRNYFLSGIALLLPIIITVNILVWFFTFLDGMLGKYINHYLLNNFGYAIPGLGLLLFVFIVFIIGFFAANFLGKKLLYVLEACFIRLPFVAKIYPHIKQFINFLFGKEKPSFKKVVLVEYPRKGVYSLGFIVNEGLSAVEERIKQQVVTVLVPNIPNPFSGVFLFFIKEDLMYLDMTIEDAIKLVISGGVLQP
ncbi:MAG: hypothetical protein COV72_09345 [Candidatus Omnitrophica bacterium CG11_big_fil_rev_8_21_14_0_20_42_13]|uniref:DUF502 domain-containing protein n=1 Tax=Candidatus Ghiorseimicrobium undicola TaxID=1974746 RepID=A0A2H0LUY5_9BACT|nr:MAG: hypothetical protein COV72_09345 [Candidatus Omnitrophica bacterium CG11_big_fil_rev_8_21_14_0_20_42_13]